MKQGLILLLAALTLFVLTACGEEVPPAVDDHMDWVWVQDTVTKGAVSESGYYTVRDSILWYFDFAAEAGTPLCQKAGCKHIGETCDAYILGAYLGNLHYWNERVYYIDGYESQVSSRDATGVDLKELGVLAEKYIEEQKGITIDSLVAADGYLYYLANVSDKIEQENGHQTLQLTLQCVGRINLETGKDEVLYEEKIEDPADERLNLCAVREKGLLINHWTNMNTGGEDADYVEKMKAAKSILLHYDAQTGITATLIEKDLQTFNGVKMVAGGKVYYKTMTNSDAANAGFTYVYDLTTGKEESACPERTRFYLGGTYVQCNDLEGNVFLYDMAEGKRLPYELEEFGFCWDVADNGFVIGFPGDNGMVYHFVSRETLADGLQQTDLVYLYGR